MRDGPDDRTDSRKHHRDASVPPARSISGESRASRASELSGISGTSGTSGASGASGASGGGATPGLQPQNRQRENLRKVLPFALERKTGLALALRASGSRILADTPSPWKGRFEVACAESLMHRHTKQKGKNLLDSSLLFWSGKRDSDPRPQPWQGCALPTELFPHFPSSDDLREVAYPCFGIANIRAFFDSAK